MILPAAFAIIWWNLLIHGQLSDSIIQKNPTQTHQISTMKCLPVYSPNIIRDMITVKIGAELLTVSANETATFFKLTRPKTTVANL